MLQALEAGFALEREAWVERGEAALADLALEEEQVAEDAPGIEEALEELAAEGGVDPGGADGGVGGGADGDEAAAFRDQGGPDRPAVGPEVCPGKLPVDLLRLALLGDHALSAPELQAESERVKGGLTEARRRKGAFSVQREVVTPQGARGHAPAYACASGTGRRRARPEPSPT